MDFLFPVFIPSEILSPLSFFPSNSSTLVLFFPPSLRAVAVYIWINWCMLSFAVSASWNEAWPFGPSPDTQVYPSPTATQASDNKQREPREKNQSCRYGWGGKLMRVWKECQHHYLGECGLFILLHASTRRIVAPASGHERCPQWCCGFEDLHLILNPKHDLFTAALHLKELRSYLAKGSAAITGVSQWKIATISASTSSKLQQAFGGNQLTAALTSAGHLGATTAQYSSSYQTETPSFFTLDTLHYLPQVPDAQKPPPPSSVHTYPSLVIVRPDQNSIFPLKKQIKYKLRWWWHHPRSTRSDLLW